MNGAHDMGGQHGYGPVVPEDDEPTFHAPWEGRVFAMALATGALGRWNIDMARFAREDTAPDEYLRRNYYERWLHGLETLLLRHGVITGDELRAALAGAHFERVADPPLAAGQVDALLRRVGPMPAGGRPGRFAVGDRVRVRVANPKGHTRAPRYVRGRVGTVDGDHGVHVFSDRHATTGDPDPQQLYSVRFEAEELWGPDGEGAAVYVDLWDDHLEPAP